MNSERCTIFFQDPDADLGDDREEDVLSVILESGSDLHRFLNECFCVTMELRETDKFAALFAMVDRAAEERRWISY